jgi:hypothetical protein
MGVGERALVNVSRRFLGTRPIHQDSPNLPIAPLAPEEQAFYSDSVDVSTS